MEIDPLSLIGVSIAIIGLGVEHFHFQAQLQERIGRLETKMDVFWGALEQKIPDMLLKGNPLDPHSEIGVLLIKQRNQNINTIEIQRLLHLLELEIKSNEHTPAETAAMLLIAATIQARMVS